MVALADWYILPILLQLGKLSGPQDALSRYSQCPKLFTEYFKLLVQPNSMAWSMLLPSANDQLNSTKSLGGSSIFRPMIKFHAVGQDKYTGFLYYGIQTSSYFCGIFKEFLDNWSSYAEFCLSCPHGPSCVMGSIELMLWSHFLRSDEGIRPGDQDYTT
jgi:hypothetical protein